VQPADNNSAVPGSQRYALPDEAKAASDASHRQRDRTSCASSAPGQTLVWFVPFPRRNACGLACGERTERTSWLTAMGFMHRKCTDFTGRPGSERRRGWLF
jgi:hypothetical protein